MGSRKKKERNRCGGRWTLVRRGPSTIGLGGDGTGEGRLGLRKSWNKLIDIRFTCTKPSAERGTKKIGGNGKGGGKGKK